MATIAYSFISVLLRLINGVNGNGDDVTDTAVANVNAQGGNRLWSMRTTYSAESFTSILPALRVYVGATAAEFATVKTPATLAAWLQDNCETDYAEQVAQLICTIIQLKPSAVDGDKLDAILLEKGVLSSTVKVVFTANPAQGGMRDGAVLYALQELGITTPVPTVQADAVQLAERTVSNRNEYQARTLSGQTVDPSKVMSNRLKRMSNDAVKQWIIGAGITVDPALTPEQVADLAIANAKTLLA